MRRAHASRSASVPGARMVRFTPRTITARSRQSPRAAVTGATLDRDGPGRELGRNRGIRPPPPLRGAMKAKVAVLLATLPLWAAAPTWHEPAGVSDESVFVHNLQRGPPEALL